MSLTSWPWGSSEA